MRPSFSVQFTNEARLDLAQLLDHLLDRARFAEDFAAAIGMIDELEAQVLSALSRSPLIYRKAAESPFLRELIVPLGGTGYVALFEVLDAYRVSVVALRHQREDDYH